MPTPSPLAAAPRRFAGGLSYGRRFVVAALLALVAACLATTPVQAVDLDWVTVGDAGNVADTTGYGSVGYDYRIGKYEITISQYSAFLNAVAKSDPYGLYNTGDGLSGMGMAEDGMIAGIARTGAAGSYVYAPIAPRGNNLPGAQSAGNRPISYINWWDAARFANWMHNGQGNGDTETGAYSLNGATSGIAPAKNSGALYYIPTEDEWYKAAFYKAGGLNAGYWKYATQSNWSPASSLPDSPTYEFWAGSSNNSANWGANVFSAPDITQEQWTINMQLANNQNFLTDVGAFRYSPSAYGTFDQSGNVSEWTDLLNVSSASRVVRGTYFGKNSNDFGPSGYYESERVYRSVVSASGFYGGGRNNGFRLASPMLSVITGSQTYNTQLSGSITVSSGASVSFASGFNGALTVAGTATLGGTVTGTVTIGAGAAATIASGAGLTNAKVALAPGASLSIPRGTHVPVAAGNIGGISISSTTGRVATVLSGSVATDVNILGNFSAIGNFSAAGGNKIVGDVLSFEGTGEATWALQMQYNPLALGGNEATLAAAGDLFLSWRNPATNTWVNSVDGNTGGTKQFFQRGWLSGDTLGSYGVDVNTHTVWAVVNHNSDFAVTSLAAVPEPSTWAMAAAGIACAAGGAWRRKARRRSP